MADTSDNQDENQESSFKEFISTLLWALGIALILRTFLFQPFHIPSGSMQPGLMKGDYIITSKYSLGYGKYAAAPFPFPVSKGRLFERKPERGDVLVFRPRDQNKNYIKRLVGLPGDQIQMVDGYLLINGKAQALEDLGTEIRLDSDGFEDETRVFRESFDNGHTHRIYDDVAGGPADNTAVFTVPSGHYFVMGDNRDHSADSRVPVDFNGAGYVPTENLMGKAEFVLLSVNNKFSLIKPWTWFNMRGDRFFMVIK